jgi:hypothetical protein
MELEQSDAVSRISTRDQTPQRLGRERPCEWEADRRDNKPIYTIDVDINSIDGRIPSNQGSWQWRER